MLLGLIAAVLCNKAFPGIRVFSTAYALPMAIASSSAAMIFQIMLHPAVGIVNKLLGLDINWLNDPNTALYCVAILTAWLNSGINFLYFSAGLGNIDETIYERASVDGASGVQQFRHSSHSDRSRSWQKADRMSPQTYSYTRFTEMHSLTIVLEVHPHSLLSYLSLSCL